MDFGEASRLLVYDIMYQNGNSCIDCIEKELNERFLKSNAGQYSLSQEFPLLNFLLIARETGYTDRTEQNEWDLTDQGKKKVEKNLEELLKFFPR